MARVTGSHQQTTVGEETVRAFVPHPLPPASPGLRLDEALTAQHGQALTALTRLQVASQLVPSARWFLYGFVRKEAVITSQIEGTQATLRDVVSYEATRQTDRFADVEEVCNYIAALEHARRELRRPKGLPLCSRLLAECHARLLRGVRGADRHPGLIRTSQNWIGGTRPGNARFVPPPPHEVPQALADLDRWLHAERDLPPLVRAGLAHVQFETIHPFLDGNGRIGRLLIALLVEHWGLLDAPLLYLSAALKRRQAEYYHRLSAVRTDGDWEGWIGFFLACVHEAAEDGVATARQLHARLDADRKALIRHSQVTIPALRLFELLPEHPVITVPLACKLMDSTPPTVNKAIAALTSTRILGETSGRKRDRVYAYRRYLDVLEREMVAPTAVTSSYAGR